MNGIGKVNKKLLPSCLIENNEEEVANQKLIEEVTQYISNHGSHFPGYH